MTYYIRFAVTDNKPIDLAEIEQGLKEVNPAYEIDGDLLVFEDEEYGLIDIPEPDTDIYDGDLELMQEFAEDKDQKEFLLSEIEKATGLIVVQAIWSKEHSETLKITYAMFEWLTKNRIGLLMDEGGYFYREFGIEIA